MPKRKNRIPGIEKRGDKWRARAFYDGKETAKTFTSQDEAIRWKREQERALERGEWIDPRLASITFEEWSKLWLKAKTNISPRTKRGYIARLNSHLLPTFGKRKLTSITNNEISQWIARSIECGAGLVVLRQSHGVLRQIFNAAVLDGRLNRNPAIGVPLPRVKPSEKRALGPTELFELATACEGYELLVKFAGTTGLRWGELSALQCKDVSLLNRTIYVGKAYSDGLKGEKILGATKTHQSRTVPFPKELGVELQMLIENRSSESHLFTMPGEGSLDYNNFMSRIFRPAVKKSGLTGVSFHTLRHTAASLLISQGTPITTVSGILGHASTQMTLDVYGHLYEDDAMSYMDRLGERLFAGTDKERTSQKVQDKKVIAIH
jgi:integrase